MSKHCQKYVTSYNLQKNPVKLLWWSVPFKRRNRSAASHTGSEAGAVTSTQGSCPMSTVSCTGPSCLLWQCASYFRGTLSKVFLSNSYSSLSQECHSLVPGTIQSLDNGWVRSSLAPDNVQSCFVELYRGAWKIMATKQQLWESRSPPEIIFLEIIQKVEKSI